MTTDLEVRLYAKISQRTTKTGCRLWRGGTKFGRTTEYGKFRAAGKGSRIWNVQRLVLLLETAATDVPPDPFEPIDVWLKRANRWYHDLGLVASHQWRYVAVLRRRAETSRLGNPARQRETPGGAAEARSGRHVRNRTVGASLTNPAKR